MRKSDGKWFLSRVRTLIKTHNLITPGDRLAVVDSGTAAGSALMYILTVLQNFQGFDFTIHPEPAGCSKLALADSADDTQSYFFHNLFVKGELKVLPPLEILQESGITVIRPLLLVPAQTLVSLARREGLPAAVEPKSYEVDPAVDFLKSQYPDITDKLLSALYRL